MIETSIFSKNTALNGGVFYLTKASKLIFDFDFENFVAISNNEAKNEGGCFVFEEKSELLFETNNLDIRNNKAKRGAAFYLQNVNLAL